MRTETEMMNLILQIADTIEVEAIALSGSRTNPQAPKDEFYPGWISTEIDSSNSTTDWDIVVCISCYLKTATVSI